MSVEKRQKKHRRAAEPSNAQLAKAFDHPTRTEILAVLNDRIASPSELADMLNVALPNVSYHMKELLKYGCVEPVEREQVRGALKTKYKATQRMLIDSDDWTSLSPESREGIAANAANEVIQRITEAVRQNTFTARPDLAVITLKFDADQQLWDEAQDIVREAYQRLAEAEAESANRRAQGRETFRMTVSMLAFESPKAQAG